MTAKKQSTKKTTGKRTKKTEPECFMDMATSQMKRCAIPTAVAITTSVVLSHVGAPIVPLALVGAGGYAWWKGYRVRVVKPGKHRNGGEG